MTASANMILPEHAQPKPIRYPEGGTAALLPFWKLPAILESTPSQTFGCDLRLPESGTYPTSLNGILNGWLCRKQT